jgi:hypothetical protein
MSIGTLNNQCPDKLLIRNDDLVKFIKNRNLIAHNYWRLSKTNIKGGEKLIEPKQFLNDFINNCDYWQAIVNGFLWLMQKEAAKKANRLDEINFTEKQSEEIKKYYSHVQKHYKSLKPAK